MADIESTDKKRKGSKKKEKQTAADSTIEPPPDLIRGTGSENARPGLQLQRIKAMKRRFEKADSVYQPKASIDYIVEARCWFDNKFHTCNNDCVCSFGW
jgi:hypothetical protein